MMKRVAVMIMVAVSCAAAALPCPGRCRTYDSKSGDIANYSVKEVMPYEPQSVCIYRRRAVMNFGVGLVTRLRIGRQ